MEISHAQVHAATPEMGGAASDNDDDDNENLA